MTGHVRDLWTTPGPHCCDMHNEHCEPPSELCCRSCTEWDHPDHRDGSTCVMTVPLSDWNDWTRHP